MGAIPPLPGKLKPLHCDHFNHQGACQISQSLGIHVITFYKGRKTWRLQGELVPAFQTDPQSWATADKFAVVLETAGLNDTELGAYCRERGLYPEQVECWRHQFAADGDGQDRRSGSHRHVAHPLSEEERQRILLTTNQPEFASLLSDRIGPNLADQGLFMGSDRSFYWVLLVHGQVHHRGRADLHRNPGRRRAYGPTVRIRAGVGTSPTCPARCGAWGCTFAR